MSKKIEFINYVEALMENQKSDSIIMNDDAKAFWDALCNDKGDDKPLFTDNGKLVMKYLQSLPADAPMMTSKTIAENMFVSSRSVSGSMRKLCSDGFVEKIGKEPVMYALTDNGRNIVIED